MHHQMYHGLVPHVMANFAAVSGTNTASASIQDASHDFVAVVGGFLRGLGRWSDEYEIRAFHFRKICEAACTGHPLTLTSMNKLAEMLSRQGKCKEAEEMHRQALRLREMVLGKAPPSRATMMRDCCRLSRSSEYMELWGGPFFLVPTAVLRRIKKQYDFTISILDRSSSTHE
jgi:hypothetical protein